MVLKLEWLDTFAFYLGNNLLVLYFFTFNGHQLVARIVTQIVSNVIPSDNRLSYLV